MNKSILHFNEEGTKELEMIEKKFFENPTNLDEMVDGVLETLLSFGLNLIKETLEEMDESIREAPNRIEKWNINRKEQTSLLCRLGNVVYKRTLFQKKKKKVEILYIDANEDHISRQFEVVKGDIKKYPNRNKFNTMLRKMIYVYEEIRPVHKTSKRKELIGKRYFGGIYKGRKGNEALWNEVAKYIDETYDADTLRKVYINGDGAGWIKVGARYIDKSQFVLDRFHLMKYINQATSHLMDSTDDAKSELYEAIRKKYKRELIYVFEKIERVTEIETKLKSIINAKLYLVNHWKGILVRINHPEILRCSAEGHISNTFSARMSSRPMGWSEHGAHQMCKLRCYKENGGNIIELVQRQKERKATGTEGFQKIVFNPRDIIGLPSIKTNTQKDYTINRIQTSIPGS